MQIEKYDPQIADEILSQLSEGKHLGQILNGTNPNYPCRATFYCWMEKRPSLRIKYDTYREAQVCMMEEELDIEAEHIRTMEHDGIKLVNHSAGVQLLEFKLKKLNHLKRSLKPRKYGDNPAYPINIKGNTPEERIEDLWRLVKLGKLSAKDANDYASLLNKQIEIRDLPKLAQTIHDLENMKEKK